MKDGSHSSSGVCSHKQAMGVLRGKCARRQVGQSTQTTQSNNAPPPPSIHQQEGLWSPAQGQPLRLPPAPGPRESSIRETRQLIKPTSTALGDIRRSWQQGPGTQRWERMSHMDLGPGCQPVQSVPGTAQQDWDKEMTPTAAA